ncbi:MAG TPA: hypothetical protein VM869_34100 [Enhygromyxa sp.]|nr:hypothetical protein [Enhygromyxa sp.]
MQSLDPARVAIDQSYEEFIDELPDELRSAARELPLLLGLTTRAGVCWTDAVAEPVILGLPTLLLGALAARIKPELRASAQRAHLFAMITAMIHERVDNGSVEVDGQLDALLLAIERQRHRALAELRLLGADRNASFMAAERETRSATAAERAVFERRSEAKLPNYVAICCGKHSLAFPATMAAVVAAGADLDELGHVHEVILGVMLGVAARGELLERSERARANRSWVVALTVDRERAEVVGEMVDLAAGAFTRAAVSARALGADELARWAQQQADQLRTQLRDRRHAA